MDGLEKSDVVFSDQFLCFKHLFWGDGEGDKP